MSRNYGEHNRHAMQVNFQSKTKVIIQNKNTFQVKNCKTKF